jgi:hypothetical protein
MLFSVSACTYRSFDEPQEEATASSNTVSGKKLTEFERQLKAMRTADFDYIFALRRKEGGAFDSEDKAYVRENKHYAANRFVFVDNEKVLFVGSNFEFPEENIKALKERFDVQDFSKPAEFLEKKKKEKEAAEKKAAEKADQEKKSKTKDK